MTNCFVSFLLQTQKPHYRPYRFQTFYKTAITLLDVRIHDFILAGPLVDELQNEEPSFVPNERNNAPQVIYRLSLDNSHQ